MPVSSLPELGKKILNFVPIYKSVYLLRMAQLFSIKDDFKVLMAKNLFLSIIGASIFSALSIVCIKKEFSPKRELTI
jgi:ABC-2 type transport system permease protein